MDDEDLELMQALGSGVTGTAPGYAPLPVDGSSAWEVVNEVSAALWNMPPTAAELAEVMTMAQPSSAPRSADQRMSNMEKQMSLMMRMMLKLMQQRSCSNSAGSDPPRSALSSRNQSPLTTSSSGSSGESPKVFSCVVCQSPPMAEKSFYKHIKKMKAQRKNKVPCVMMPSNALLRKFNGSHSERVCAFCDAVLECLRPGSQTASTVAGTGNERRVAALMESLMSD